MPLKCFINHEECIDDCIAWVKQGDNEPGTCLFCVTAFSLMTLMSAFESKGMTTKTLEEIGKVR